MPLVCNNLFEQAKTRLSLLEQGANMSRIRSRLLVKVRISFSMKTKLFKELSKRLIYVTSFLGQGISLAVERERSNIIKSKTSIQLFQPQPINLIQKILALSRCYIQVSNDGFSSYFLFPSIVSLLL